MISADTIYIRSLKTGEQTSLGPIEAGDSVISWSADCRHLFIQHDTSEKEAPKSSAWMCTVEKKNSGAN